MNDFLQKKTPFVIVVLGFILFTLLFFVLVPYEDANASLWFAYAFLDFSFVILGSMSFFLKLKSQNAIVAVEPILFSSLGYFAINLLVNLIIMLANPESVKACIALNLVILILYAIVFVLTNKGLGRVEKNTEIREKRVANLRELTVKVIALKSMTQDEAVSAEIQKLKECIEYASSATNEAAREYEEKFARQLDTIEGMLLSNADASTVLNALSAAEGFLKMRNQMLLIK